MTTGKRSEPNAATRAMSRLVIDCDATIRDAMIAITENAREVVLVADPAGRISGLITDGDIRRGLLSGQTLDSPAAAVMSHSFTFVGQDADRATVLELMKARSLQHVPALGSDRRLVAIHFIRDLLGMEKKPNVAVVMAGGMGKRLRPLTEQLPKPMVEVAGRPILERIVLHLVGHGITSIYLAVNYKAEIIERHFGNGSQFGCQISYLRETEARGSGGALSLLPQRPSEPLLVMNGDQITRVDLNALLDHHRRAGATATMAVGSHRMDIPFGVVTEADGRLKRLQEKPSISVLVNRGTYVLDPEALDIVPSRAEFPITELFEMLMEQGRHVSVFQFEDTWYDIGRPSDLLAANGIV